MAKHETLVVVEFYNSGISVVKFLSDEPVTQDTFDRIIRYYEAEHQLDAERDSVTLTEIDDTVDLDAWEEAENQDDEEQEPEDAECG